MQPDRVLWLQHRPHRHPPGDWKAGESSVLYSRDQARHRHGGHLPISPWHSPSPDLVPGSDLGSGWLSLPEDLDHRRVWPVWEQSQLNDWRIKVPAPWSLGWHNSEECPTRSPKNCGAHRSDLLVNNPLLTGPFFPSPSHFPATLLGLSEVPPSPPGEPSAGLV